VHRQFGQNSILAGTINLLPALLFKFHFKSHKVVVLVATAVVAAAVVVVVVVSSKLIKGKRLLLTFRTELCQSFRMTNSLKLLLPRDGIHGDILQKKSYTKFSL
jgi:hypothetical protein